MRPQAYPNRALSRTAPLKRHQEIEELKTRKTLRGPLTQPYLLALDRLRRRTENRQGGGGDFISTAKEILDLLGHCIRFDAAWVIKLNRQNFRFVKVHLHQFSRSAFSEYRGSFRAAIPGPRQLKSKDLISQKGSDLIDKKSWRSTPFYRTLLQPLDLEYFLIGACVDSDRNYIGLICLWRSPVRRDFTDSDLLFFERASGDCAALLKGNRERRGRAARTGAAPAAKRGAPGIFVLGSGNEIVFMNEEAQTLLGFVGDGESGENDRRAFLFRLHQVREKVLKHDLVRGPERSVLREKGSTSLDHLFTFRGISFSCRGTVLEGGAANPGLVLLLVEAVERPESPSDRFDPSGGQGRSSAEEYGLTGQEETVAKWISRGLTNKEIASELGISVHTIKGHLKQVMKKLEVTTRSAITTKIMTR